MEMGLLLTRSGLTYPEVFSEVCHDSFCQLGNSVSLPWVIYYGAFYLHVVSSFSSIPVICLKLVLFLIPLQFVHLFFNQSKCILLFFSCISSVLLLFFWRPLLHLSRFCHLFTRSGLTYPEVSSKVCHDSFCQLGNSVSLPCLIYYGAFYLHVVSSFSCIPVICLKLVLFLIPLQFVHLFLNLSKCILLFFSCISSLLLLFFWHPLL